MTIEYIPTLPFPSDINSIEDVVGYQERLYQSLTDYFTQMAIIISDEVATVDLDDLANTTLVDPDADRIVFWDDGAGVYTWLAPDGTTVEISGTTLQVVQGGIDHGNLAGLADDDHTQYIRHNLSTAASDFLVGSGSNTFIKKTLAETGAILEGDINHDNLQGFVADEHIDWTAVANNGVIYTDGVRLWDTDDSHTMLLYWLDNASGNQALGIGTDGGSRNLILYENFTIGNGQAGTLIYLNSSKTLTVEDDSNVNQDLTTDASPTFTGVTCTNLTVDTNTLYVDSTNNRIGIGTASPNGILDIQQQGAILAQVATCASSGAAFHSSRITWKRARNTLAMPQTIVANDTIGLFSFQGYDGSGYVECGLITIECQTNPTDVGDIVPSRLKFKTMDSSGTLNENLRVRHDGGIMFFNLKSGATQAAAGAAANELWETSSHVSLPDHVLMIGA